MFELRFWGQNRVWGSATRLSPKRALGWRKSYDLRHDSDADTTHNVNLSPNLDNPWTSRLSLRWVLGIERIDVLRPRRETQETVVHRPLIPAIKNHPRDNSEENVGWAGIWSSKVVHHWTLFFIVHLPLKCKHCPMWMRKNQRHTLQTYWSRFSNHLSFVEPRLA